MATRPNWPQLAQGQNSTNVKALQYLLVYHGANISTDGIFGSGTKAAVVNFQNNNGLSADGNNLYVDFGQRKQEIPCAASTFDTS